MKRVIDQFESLCVAMAKPLGRREYTLYGADPGDFGSIIPMRWFGVCARVCLLLALALSAACGAGRYYGQAAVGHLSLIHRARPIREISDTVDPTTAKALELITRARGFAQEELELDFNDSYTTYVDLGRDYVVKNLFVAEEFSTELHSWCYLVIGCAQYRGFFNEDLLVEEERQFIDEGYDV
ncbi:MAG: aminopeptidase, partial [Pseudomonadota bacterium]